MDTANNLYDVVVGVHTASNGTFGVVILVIVFVISFFSSIRDGPVTALISSGLLTSVAAIVVVFLGWIAWSVVVIPIMILFAGLIIKFFQK